ncbi:MAG TPA: PEP-CTERM sorting domain-containing protein [Pirellulales bacterium]
MSTKASILNYSSTIVVIPAPANVTPGNLESDKRIRVFAEQQHLTLAHDLAVDITVPGTSPAGGVPNLSIGSIAAGTLVDSYLLHFDDAGTPGDPVHITGSIAFSDDILGIIVLAQSLDGTDAYPGLTTTIYPFGDAARGLELHDGNGSDSITFSTDLHTIALDFHNIKNTDEVRVITASTVPEPSTFALTVVAGLGLFLWLRRRSL